MSKDDDNPSLRITIDPEVMGGAPCIRGMRVTVDMIASCMREHEMDDWQILDNYPYLEQEDLDAVRKYLEL